MLRAYAEDRSEAAFAELVRRHLDLVYSAALRMVCDAHLAKDVAQGVFVALAKNAGQLTDRPVLSGWLHRTAQNIAAQTVRTEVRRRAREQEAAAMNEAFSCESDAGWEQIAPELDAALGALSEPDRDALLLRYFEKKSAREMAQVLNVSEEAAQKRVNRAVERLREFFAKRNVTVGASGLAVLISTNAVQAAPVGLAISISAATALAGTVLSSTATVAATKTIAMTTLQKTLVTATVVILTGATIYESREASQLRREVQALQQRQKPLMEQIEHLQRDKIEVADRLSLLADAVERARGNSSELLKLRGEVGVLRRRNESLEASRKTDENAQSDSPGTQEKAFKHQRESWAFVGYATPEDTIQTSAWAMSEGDVKTFLESVTPGFRAWIETAFKDQEEIVIEGLNGFAVETTAYRIVNTRTNSADTRTLFVWFDDAYGNGKGVPMSLKLIDGKWRIASPKEVTSK